MTDINTAFARIEAAARAGELDFSEVRSTDDAIAARIGYQARAEDETLPLDERRFAYDFIADLDCDFG